MRCVYRIGCSVCVSLAVLSAFGQEAPAPTPAAAPALPTMQQANATLQGGDPGKAAEMFRAICDANPQNGQAWLLQGYALHMAKRYEEALPVHLKAATFPQARPVALYNAGCVHALMGRPDEAFEMLRLSADAGQMTLEQVTEDTDLASLHGDARWGELVERVRIAGQNSPAKALYFWVGEWDCYAPTGQLTGTNTLELINNGMFIHEQWTNAQGQSGQSFNYYDLEPGMWRQVWVDPSRTLDMSASPTTPGRLMFEGVNYTLFGERTLRRMLVQKLDGGRVYQEGRTSDDGGQTWTVEFRLVYVKKGEAFSGEGLPEPGV